MNVKGALSREKAAEIRAAYAPCECCGRPPTQRMLAERFGVSVVAIHNVVNNLAYKVKP